jgi:trk system potassium uptake protein TrkH
MNYKLVSKYLGFFSFVIGLLMVPSILWALYFGEKDALVAFALSIALASAIGFLLAAFGRKASKTMYQREALALVALSWFIAAFIGAFPYLFIGALSPADSFFESMSGFTTTGSTVIQDIESQAKSLLFWRSFSQWLGGVGIVVLFIAVLPYLGAGGKQLFKSESTGPDPRGLSPRIKDTASVLYKIYFTFTILMALMLMQAGMSFFEAICHTLSTISSGGFSTRQASIGAFDSVQIELIVQFFMILAGTSFALFFVMLRKNWKAPFVDTEWKTFIGIILIVTLIITLNLTFGSHVTSDGSEIESPYVMSESLRVASFQTIALLTGTGFGISDYDVWPPLSRMLLFTIFFFGGCAGSTAGGLKIVRVVMLAKIAYWRIENTFRPKTVRAIRVGDNVIDDDTRKSVHAFFVIYISIFVFGSIFMAGVGLPMESAMASVSATLNNVGPGFNLVGPTNDYSQIPDLGKLFLSLCMVAGRLELFSICVLFVPSFWKHS